MDGYLQPRRDGDLDWRDRAELHDYKRREARARGYIEAAASVAKTEAQVRIRDGLELADGAARGLAELDQRMERLTRSNPGLAGICGELEYEVLMSAKDLIRGVMRRPSR